MKLVVLLGLATLFGLTSCASDGASTSDVESERAAAHLAWEYPDRPDRMIDERYTLLTVGGPAPTLEWGEAKPTGPEFRAEAMSGANGERNLGDPIDGSGNQVTTSSPAVNTKHYLSLRYRHQDREGLNPPSSKRWTALLRQRED